MKWESKVLAGNQMLSSCLCVFKYLPSPSWIIALPAALISLYLVFGFGSLSVFLYTFLILLFSTILYSTSASNHHKAACAVDVLVKEKAESSVEESSDQRDDTADAKEEGEEMVGDDKGGEEKASYSAEESSDQREHIEEAKEEEEEEIGDDNNCGEEKADTSVEECSDQSEDIAEAEIEEEEIEDDNNIVVKNNFSNRSPDSLSNSESQEMSTSEEPDEMVYSPLDRSIDGSDGSISDEESLIEIALPSGHCSLKHQQQHSLMMMELLPEYNVDMNEEDNLIEIDISMGSIKSYSRFEIQA